METTRRDYFLFLFVFSCCIKHSGDRGNGDVRGFTVKLSEILASGFFRPYGRTVESAYATMVCEDMSFDRVLLPAKRVSLKISSAAKSRIPFNYFGKDTPVYSSGGNGSFIRFVISAKVLSGTEGIISCGVILFNFPTEESYNDFIHTKATSYSLSKLDHKCVTIGSQGSPYTSTVNFSLGKEGYYRQAMLVTVNAGNIALNINLVTGTLFQYNTIPLDSAFCKSFKQNLCAHMPMESVLHLNYNKFCFSLFKNQNDTMLIGIRVNWDLFNANITTVKSPLLFSDDKDADLARFLYSLRHTILLPFSLVIGRNSDKQTFTIYFRAAFEIVAVVIILILLIIFLVLCPCITLVCTAGGLVLYCTRYCNKRVRRKFFRPHSDFLTNHLSNPASFPDYVHSFSLLQDCSGRDVELNMSSSETSLKYPHPKSFCKTTKLCFDAKGLKYHLSDHGITVIIPENAVNETATFEIGVYPFDAYQFPEGYRLVSPVFWIHTSLPLQLPMEVYVPHFVDVQTEEDTKRLCCFLASDESFISTGLLKFTEQIPCNFKPKTSYGKILSNHFCSGCILEKLLRNSNRLPLMYRVTSVFPKDLYQESWTVAIVFSFGLPFCLKTIKKQYPKDSYSLEGEFVTFTQSAANLEIESITPGWDVGYANLNRKQIKEEEIDHMRVFKMHECTNEFLRRAYKEVLEMEKMKNYPPRLILKVFRKNCAQKDLRANVLVKGVEPELLISIYAPLPGNPPSADEQPKLSIMMKNFFRKVFGVLMVPLLQIFYWILPSRADLTVNNKDRFIRDVLLILQNDLAKEWSTFGLYLGLKHKEIDDINRKYIDEKKCFRELIVKWKGKFGSDATWTKIVCALKEIAGIFSQIGRVEEKYSRLMHECRTMEEQRTYTDSKNSTKGDNISWPSDDSCSRTTCIAVPFFVAVIITLFVTATVSVIIGVSKTLLAPQPTLLSSNSTHHRVSSVKKLLNEFPIATITNPAGTLICPCLTNFPYATCRQIAEDNHHKSKAATTEILTAWYNIKLPQLTWEDVVESLMCCDLVNLAVALAEKFEVDWEPLHKKWLLRKFNS